MEPKNIETEVEKLLDETIHAKGTYGVDEFKQLENILHVVKRQNKMEAETINLCFDLLERGVQEMSLSQMDPLKSRILASANIVTLVNFWREAAKAGAAVYSPRSLEEKMERMANIMPEFSYDRRIMGMILDVLIAQSQPDEAPILAEQMISKCKVFFTKEPMNSEKVHAEYVVLYNQLMMAWARCNLNIFRTKMDNLLYFMRTKGPVPDEVTYNIIIRKCAERSALRRIESILSNMKEDGVEPSPLTLLQALYGYTRSRKMDAAEDLLQQMIHKQTNEPVHQDLDQCVSRGAQNILLVYRNVVDESSTTDSATCAQAIKSVENLYDTLNNVGFLADQSKRKLLGTVMDIFARGRRHDKVMALFNRDLVNDPFFVCILMKSLGKIDCADRAIDALKKLLEDAHITPTNELFHTVISTLLDSSRSDTIDQCFEVINLMENHDKSQEYGLHPNVTTLGLLLRILSKSDDPQGWKRAEQMLDKIENICLLGKDPLEAPTEQAYRSVINAYDLTYLRNPEAADRVWKLYERMLSDNVEPQAEDYMVIIRAFAKSRDPEKLSKAERLLYTMKQNKRASCVPSQKHFSPLIRAWVSLDNDRATKLLISAAKAGVYDAEILTMVITEWLNSQDLPRATSLLDEIQTLHDRQFIPQGPDPRLYQAVYHAWLSSYHPDKSNILSKLQERISIG
jgi:pentatricopeptide repeat protein